MDPPTLCNIHNVYRHFQSHASSQTINWSQGICCMWLEISIKVIAIWTFSNYQLNAQFLYSSTICMLHYDPQYVSSSTLLILRRTNCITTASGIVTVCKQPYPQEDKLYYYSVCSPLSTCILYGCLQRVTIPEAVVIQFVLLRMSRVLLETCWGS